MMQESEFFKQLKAAEPFFVMAGPNVIQSEEHVLKLARQIKAVTDKLGLLLVFKSSFDKANRTSATSFRGPGLEEGLRSTPCPKNCPMHDYCLAMHYTPHIHHLWPRCVSCYCVKCRNTCTMLVACADKVLRALGGVQGLAKGEGHIWAPDYHRHP